MVQEEDRAGVAELAELSLGENRYVIKGLTSGTHCVGEIIANLSDADEQFTIATTGWIKLRLGQSEWTQQFSSTAAFNPLGQLSASIFQSVVDKTEIRVGLSDINPIRLQFVTSPPMKVLLEQVIPGPIEITKRGTTYVITARALGDILPNATPEQLKGLPSPVHITKVAAASAACTKESAVVLDLTPIIRGVEALRSQLDSFFASPKP
jgi:hypothetical protein